MLFVAIPARNGVVVLACVVVFGTRCARGDGIREDELSCEEASVQLEECCPELDIENFDCDYDDGGCEYPDDPTILTLAESYCIEALDCDAIAEWSLCEQVQARVEARSPFSTSSGRTALDLGACP